MGSVVQEIKQRIFNYTSIPFLTPNCNVNLPIVEVYNPTLGKLNLLVDTGSNTSIICSTVVPQEYKTFSKSLISSSGNQIVGEGDITLLLHIEGYKYSNVFSIHFMNIAFGEVEKECNLTIHGILGTDFLMKHNAKIDFKTNTLNLYGKRIKIKE